MNSTTPKRNCLVVEDNEDHAFLIEKALTKIATVNHVATRTTAEAALEYIQQFSDSLDLVLMDINLPDMNGFDCIEIMRRQMYGASLKCIVLTTSDARRDRERASTLGVAGYLLKPLKPEDLQPILEAS